MRFTIQIFLFIFPWKLRKVFLEFIFNYKIHPNSRIGYSVVLAKNLEMNEHCRIGHLTLIKGLDLVYMDKNSRIGNLNWITAFPTTPKSDHFSDVVRKPQLTLLEHSAITNRHLIDCTDSVSIGRFSTFAGFRSQILTHSIKLSEARQRCTPVKIGDYCFVGTGSIFLPGTSLPSFSVLSAGSVLTKSFNQEYFLYTGNPAIPSRAMPKTHAYFSRENGFIV